ncbi:NADPH oxidase organizer 1-like [Hyla sarda]|uniref:NADPH oxidase organizer 1-like n=1 Tax=Hyla sarda TaxID=327740 RepID=UPI0024C4428D|nr:NADPH oxidase organizer 1-like [Hyla sarda]
MNCSVVEVRSSVCVQVTETGDMSRYPVEAKAVGLVQHDRQKLYMFSILWSDCNDILIYRTCDDFKNLSKLLAQKFPLEAGAVNKEERILPILKDVPLLFRSKFSNRFLERLHLLEKYCKELLQTDPKISQCEEVIQFFTPNKQDLSPSFPENSMVIMPSDKDQQKQVTHPPKSTKPTTTQPIISEAYVCIDAFETKDTKNRSFKVKKNQLIDVLIKDPSGWWLVENEEKHLAWFPAPYLRKAEPVDNTDSKRKSFYKGLYYYAEKGYEAQHTDEISLTVGVVVEVIEKSEIGWWLICYNGRFGYVPSMFLKPYKNPHQKLQVTLDHNLSGSSPNLSKIVNNLDTDSDPQYRTYEVGTPKGKLQRMKSISLDALNEGSDLTSVTSSRQSNVYVEWEIKKDKELTSPSMSGNPRSVHTVASIHERKMGDDMEGKERKDSGFEERLSPRTSISSDDAGPTPPALPQRPTLEEIRSRCTTITRNAALQGSV